MGPRYDFLAIGFRISETIGKKQFVAHKTIATDTGSLPTADCRLPTAMFKYIQNIVKFRDLQKLVHSSEYQQTQSDGCKHPDNAWNDTYPTEPIHLNDPVCQPADKSHHH